MKAALTPYRVMASIVGVLLIVLVLVGLPLHYLFPDGSQPERLGAGISQYLGVAHGWLYMIFLIAAFVLSRKAGWDLRFTIVTLLCGTIPILSFWAERRATARVQAELRSQDGRSTAGASDDAATQQRSRTGGPTSSPSPGD